MASAAAATPSLPNIKVRHDDRWWSAGTSQSFPTPWRKPSPTSSPKSTEKPNKINDAIAKLEEKLDSKIQELTNKINDAITKLHHFETQVTTKLNNLSVQEITKHPDIKNTTSSNIDASLIAKLDSLETQVLQRTKDSQDQLERSINHFESQVTRKLDQETTKNLEIKITTIIAKLTDLETQTKAMTTKNLDTKIADIDAKLANLAKQLEIQLSEVLHHTDQQNKVFHNQLGDSNKKLDGFNSFHHTETMKQLNCLEQMLADIDEQHHDDYKGLQHLVLSFGKAASEDEDLLDSAKLRPMPDFMPQEDFGENESDEG